MAFEVYRLTVAKWAGDLSGEGARLYGARWNERGTAAVYTAQSVALAYLENLVHVGDLADLPDEYTITVIEVDREIDRAFDTIPSAKEDAQVQGSARLGDTNLIGFWVPSIIIPREHNLVLNPRCVDFGTAIKVKETYVLKMDHRLRR